MAVPAPAALLLLVSGLFALVGYCGHRRKKEGADRDRPGGTVEGRPQGNEEAEEDSEE